MTRTRRHKKIRGKLVHYLVHFFLGVARPVENRGEILPPGQNPHQTR
jgi:hypothetical protein